MAFTYLSQRKTAGKSGALRQSGSTAAPAFAKMDRTGLGTLQRLAAAATGPGRLGVLQRLADNRMPPSAGAVVQRAGDFTGLMLPHEKQQGAPEYFLNGKTYKRDAAGEHKLTYHHIVPEGKLARLGPMMMRFEHLFGKKNSYTDELTTLRRELDSLKEEADRKRAAINLGEASWRQIQNVYWFHSRPEAEKRVQGRSLNENVAKGEEALSTLEQTTEKFAVKERQIHDIKASLTFTLDETRVLEGKAPDVAADGDAPARQGTGNETRLAVLKVQIENLVESTRTQAEAVRKSNVDRMRDSSDSNVKDRADKLASQDIRLTFSDEYNASLAFAGTTWIPGNIHEGPTARISRTDKNPQFKEDRDDGGSDFEKSAQHLLEPAHFQLLQELSINLQKFEEKDSTAFDAARIDQFIDLLIRINKVRDPVMLMTKFETAKWEQVKTTANTREAIPMNKENASQPGYPYAGIISPSACAALPNLRTQ